MPLPELVGRFQRYAASGEINSRVVADVADSLDGIRAWATERGAAVDTLDGLTVSVRDWFDVRRSNIEPLRRLNVEAASSDEMTTLRDEILAVIRG